MIVKYLSDEVWAYIDHVRQVAKTDFDAGELIKQYDAEVKSNTRKDDASWMNEMQISNLTASSNKIFTMISEQLGEMTEGLDAHSVNLVNTDDIANVNLPVYSILLYIEDCKDYDALVLITNQKCYLMNDEGKTIERLV